MLVLNIIKELIKWTVFRKGWRFVLIAFVIAIFDTIAWSFFSRDARVEVPIELTFSIIGIIYIILYVGTEKMQLLEQELRWLIRNIYNKKPNQVNLCIITFILSSAFNLYLGVTVFVIICAFVIKSLPIGFFRTKDFQFIEKLIYNCIPTIFMVSWFKIFLKTLMTSVTVIEILSNFIYEFLLVTTIISLIILLAYLCGNLYYHKSLLILLLRFLIRVFVPICSNCEQMLLGIAWCQNCGKKYFAQNLSKWTSGSEIIDEIIKKAQFEAKYGIDYVEWIPYDEFDKIKQIGKGGCGTVYSAVWKNGPLTMILDGKFFRLFKQSKVAIKVLDFSANITEFLRELKASLRCSTSHASNFKNTKVLRCYGLSQNPITKEYLFVMELGENGDLFRYLQANFLTLKWFDKLSFLNDIAIGLKIIHEAGLVHHDLHPGNVIIGQGCTAYLSDLGLSCPVNEESSSGIYGVLTFLAPEVLRGGTYTTASDVYSFGMIMWVLTSGQNPFSDIKQDACSLVLKICGNERPSIIEEITPDCYQDLMIRCWNGNPSERPSASELEGTLRRWILGEFEDKFTEADNIFQSVIKDNKRKGNDGTFEHDTTIYIDGLLSNESLIVDSPPEEYSVLSSVHIPII